MDTSLEDKIDTACNNYKIAFNSHNTKFQKLDDWLETESKIFVSEAKDLATTYLKYKRGQLIKVDFGINIGTEISHTHFAIVLNNDDTIFTDNITVLPLTSKKGYKRIKLNDLVSQAFKSQKYQNKTYGVITQIKTISKKRILLNNKNYICDDAIMEIIKQAIKDYLF